MGKFIGNIKKEYTLAGKKKTILDKVPEIVNEMEEIQVNGQYSTVLFITSTRKFYFNIFRYPNFTDRGVASEKDEKTTFDFTIKTYWLMEYLPLVVAVILLIFLGFWGYGRLTGAFPVKGEWSNLYLYLLISAVVLTWNRNRVFSFKKKGGQAIDKLMAKLNNPIT